MQATGTENCYVIEMIYRCNRPDESWTIGNARDARIWYAQLSVSAPKLGMSRVILHEPDGSYMQTIVP